MKSRFRCLLLKVTDLYDMVISYVEVYCLYVLDAYWLFWHSIGHMNSSVNQLCSDNGPELVNKDEK